MVTQATKYIFVKVSDKQVVIANTEQEAIETAFKQNIIKPEDLKDFVVLKEEFDGEYQAGTLDLNFNWH